MAERSKMSEADPNPTSSAIPILIQGEQDNVSWEIETRNPLQNPLVLVEVFKNLSHEDLTNCRLVNKLWRSEATPIFKRITRVSFYADHDYVTDENGQLEFLPQKIERYLMEMRDFGIDDFDIKVYKDDDQGERHDFGAVMTLLDEFFPHFGTQIKTLDFMFCFRTLADFEIFRQIVKLIPNVLEFTLELELFKLVQYHCGISDLIGNVKQLENVRKLDLAVDFRQNEEDSDSEDNQMDYIFNPLNEKVLSKFVFQLFPKLESLILREIDFSGILLYYTNFAKLYESKISEIEIHNYFTDWSVEEFEKWYSLYDNNKTIEILCRWPTPLRKLRYYSNASCIKELDAKGLENLLKKHAASLEDIEISVSAYKEFNEMQEINMPTFPKLIHLNIQNPSASNSCKLNFKFHSTFDQHFPSLKAKNDKLVEMFDKLT